MIRIAKISVYENRERCRSGEGREIDTSIRGGAAAALHSSACHLNVQRVGVGVRGGGCVAASAEVCTRAIAVSTRVDVR